MKLKAVSWRICGFLVITTAVAFGANEVDVQITSGGIGSLKYRGIEYLYEGRPGLRRVLLEDAAGRNSQGALAARTTGTPDRGTVRSEYGWGTILYTWRPLDSRVNLTIEITNTGTSAITSLWLDPLILQLPSSPSEYDGDVPLLAQNRGEPSILTLTSGPTMVALVNEDVARPLLVGFPFAADPSTRRRFGVIVETGQSQYSDRLPVTDRRIAPGATERFELSLRFGAASESVVAIAGDVLTRFAQRYPLRFGWTDRRPIGTLFLSAANAGYATNPRGWFNDPALDVTSPAGLEIFRQRLLDWADGSVTELQAMGAQGAVVWDIEGQQYDHPVSYIGDPRLLPDLAPEMEAIADDFFARFRAAGLRVGVAIRPQLFRRSAETAGQTDSTLPSQTIIDKIDYAKRRWGATLFYIDSNGDPNFPFDPDIMIAVQQAHPDVLIMPEHKRTAYFSFSAPYQELRNGFAITPQRARDVYPDAFSVINTADGPIYDSAEQLLQAIRRGDILLFRGWYHDPANDMINALYDQSGTRKRSETQ